MFREIGYWAVLVIIGILGAAILQCHILHWDLQANLFVVADIILLGIFIRATIRREIRAALTEHSSAEKGPGG